MARQALYRMYRPRQFSEVAGQEQPVRILREAVRQNRLTHAYLFSGPRGTGKTSVARIFAKAVNCQAPDSSGEPCMTCPSCRALDDGNHLDIIEIDAASNRGIDEIRDMKERIAHLPVMARMKVYIIDEVHMLTPEAFNALLKTLEEPPPHILFILATTEPHKIPVTVLSRCQRYEFERLRLTDIIARLKEVLTAEAAAFDEPALELIAEVSEGALRDALSLLDQVLAMEEGTSVSRAAVAELVGSLQPEVLEPLLLALAGSSPQDLLAAIEEAYRRGGDVRQMVRDIARGIRDVMVFRTVGPDRFASFQREWLDRLNRRLPNPMPSERWFWALEALAEGEDRLRGGFPPQLILELTLFKVQRQWQDAPDAGVERERPIPTTSAPAPAKAPPSIPIPEPEEPESDTLSGGRVQQLLERLRKGRVSVHALVQSAQIEEVGDSLRLRFVFDAHRDLLTKSENREVFEKAFHSVYGPDATYRLEMQSRRTASSPADLKEKVQGLFGPEVRLVGFDENEAKEGSR